MVGEEYFPVIESTKIVTRTDTITPGQYVLKEIMVFGPFIFFETEGSMA